MGKVRNRNLYDYIVENYIEAKNPMTQQELADNYGLSIGAVKNFMFRHKLNKKEYYKKNQIQVKAYIEKGLNANEIAKLMNTTTQYVYSLAKRHYEKTSL